MFPFERNGVRSPKEGAYESWHQVVTVASTPAAINPGDRYNLVDIEMFDAQARRTTTFNPQIEVTPVTKRASKRLKCVVLGKTKPKRLSKRRTGVKRLSQKALGKVSSSKGRKKSLRLKKKGVPVSGMVQKVLKKLKKRTQKKTQK